MSSTNKWGPKSDDSSKETPSLFGGMSVKTPSNEKSTVKPSAFGFISSSPTVVSRGVDVADDVDAPPLPPKRTPSPRVLDLMSPPTIRAKAGVKKRKSVKRTASARSTEDVVEGKEVASDAAAVVASVETNDLNNDVENNPEEMVVIEPLTDADAAIDPRTEPSPPPPPPLPLPQSDEATSVTQMETSSRSSSNEVVVAPVEASSPPSGEAVVALVDATSVPSEIDERRREDSPEMETFRASAAVLRLKLETIDRTLQRAHDRVTAALVSKALLGDELQQKEREQLDATTDDDFERAETLQEEIDLRHRETMKCDALLRTVREDVQRVQRERDALRVESTVLLRETTEAVDRLVTRITSGADSSTTETAQIADEEDLQGVECSIEQSRQTYESLKESVRIARNEATEHEATVERATSDEIAAVAAQSFEVSRIEDEIIETKKILERLENERVVALEKRLECEAVLDESRAPFAQRSEALATSLESAEASVRNSETETERLVETRRHILERIESRARSAESAEARAISLRSDALVLTWTLEAFSANAAELASNGGVDEEEKDDQRRILQLRLESLDTDDVMAERELDTLREQSLAVREERALGVVSARPLEAQKKAAVAARNFKEAGRLTTELKALAAKDDAKASELANLAKREESVFDLMRSRGMERQAVSDELRDLEKARTTKACRKLRKRMRRVRRSVRTERDEDDVDSFGAVVRQLVRVELATMQSEYDRLVDACGYSSAADDPLSDDDGEAENAASNETVADAAAVSVASEVDDVRNRMEEIEQEIVAAITRDDFETAASLEEELQQLAALSGSSSS